MRAHGDFESRSELDLKLVGLHRYARHASTAPWCLAHAIGDAEPELWLPGQELSTPFRRHIEAGGPFVAHNAPFELELWNEICVARYGFPRLAPEQTYCTMAMAYAMGLPGALEDGAMALGMELRKDGIGRALMLKYASPWRRDPTRWQDECPSFTLQGQKWTGPEGLARLREYCRQDVRVERGLEARVLPLSATERRVWLLDYRINQRGVQIDVASARAAIALAETVKAECNAELAKITGGAVQAVTAVPALKAWLTMRGVEVDSLAKQAVVDLLDDTADVPNNLPADVRRALVLRQEAGKASNAKFNVMLNRAGDDGRLRQMYQYHGAGPGRWAGRAVQTHNLPRDMPKAEAVERILTLVREGKHEAIDAIYGPPLTMISKCLRSFFVAPPGEAWLSGDWANVEGRGQAWFAGEDWKLRAFVAADNKTGPGIYELAYSRMFNVPVESVLNPSEERQVGKVSELAFGYQGGVGSFHVMGKTYGVKVPDAQADQFKEAWRDAHPKIAGVRNERGYRTGGVWREIENAAIAAVRSPGETFQCGHPERPARYKVVGSFLWCLLPSGRAICYPYPKLLEGKYGPQLTYMTVPSQEDRRKGKVIFDTMNAPNWVRIGTYGGSLFNNIVQGFCRDFLAGCMLVLDDKGLPIVLHTHDDINGTVAAEKAERARAAMQDIMRTPPEWALGFPLFAEVKIMSRYGK